MLLSEAINQLNEMMQKHGDLPLFVDGSCETLWEAEFDVYLLDPTSFRYRTTRLPSHIRVIESYTVAKEVPVGPGEDE